MTNQCDSASSKPLWQRFYGMSESEAAAEIAEDRRRMQSGEITELKAQERADAWKRSAEQQLREADALRRYRALRTGTVLDAD